MLLRLSSSHIKKCKNVTGFGQSSRRVMVLCLSIAGAAWTGKAGSTGLLDFCSNYFPPIGLIVSALWPESMPRFRSRIEKRFATLPPNPQNNGFVVLHTAGHCQQWCDDARENIFVSQASSIGWVLQWVQGHSSWLGQLFKCMHTGPTHSAVKCIAIVPVHIIRTLSLRKCLQVHWRPLGPHLTLAGNLLRSTPYAV